LKFWAYPALFEASVVLKTSLLQVQVLDSGKSDQNTRSSLSSCLFKLRATYLYMGSKAYGRMKRREKETALLPHHFWHCCSECAWFSKEWPWDNRGLKKYCGKWDRKVRPERRAWSCFITRRKPAKDEMPLWYWLELQNGTTDVIRPVWKKGRCHWCAREFWYKTWDPKIEKRFHSKWCRRKYNRFWRKQSSPLDVYSFVISWGPQPAKGPILTMKIIAPTRIAYFNQPKFLTGYYWLFVVDKFGRCVPSAFIALDS